MTVDLDSTVCEVCGRAKHGAAYGHTKVLGYHPLVAVRSDTGEVLHSRMRSGSSQRGNVHFARETLARLRRLAPDATVTVRADAGFFSYDMIAAIGAHGASYSITIPQNAKVKAAIAAIDDDAWASRSRTPAAARPRWLRPPSMPAAAATSSAATTARPRSCGSSCAAPACSAPRRELWPNWRHHCFVTDRADLDTKAADAYHRNHATVELAIQRPQRERRAQPLPLRTILRQRRLARLQRARTQPRALDRPPRTHPPHSASSPSRPPSATGSSPWRAASSTTAGRHRLRLPLNWPWAEHLHHRPRTRIRSLPQLI